MGKRRQRDIIYQDQLVADYEGMRQKGNLSYLSEDHWLTLIEHYVGENFFNKALQASSVSIKQHSFSIELHLQHARMLLSSDKISEALNFISKYNYLSPNDPEFILLEAQCYNEMEDADEALVLLLGMEVPQDPDFMAEVYLSKADAFEKKQLFGSMFDALRDVLLVTPGNVEALERIWLCTEITGRYDESIELHRNIIDEDPFSHHAWYNLGQALLSLEELEEAAEALEYAYLINEDFEFAYRDRGEALLSAQRCEEAYACYLEVKERFVPDSDLYSKLGQCLCLLDKHEMAIEHLNVALQMGSVDAEVHYFMGVSLAQIDKVESAKDSFQKAIQMDEDREDFHLALADTFFQLGKLIEAKAHFQKAIDIGPDEKDTWLQFALFEFMAHGEEEALNVIEEALFYVDAPHLYYLKVVCLLSAGKRQEAILELMQVLEDAPETRSFLLELMPDLRTDHEVMELLA